ncbi:MAG TPA: hypothetical protein VNN22_23640 [Verrucomicrobiae bacterium]|nr:hypothetical protein [Verrucomicrobiae bacterium]
MDHEKTKPARRVRPQPLADGQLWRMAEANLQVGMVGKLLVHYKLGKPDASPTLAAALRPSRNI